MSCGSKNFIIFGGILVIILLIFLLFRRKNKKIENFGPVKTIRRIPKNDCYRLCGQYYMQCMGTVRGEVDADGCAIRRRNCMAECNYSDYHRL